MYFLLFYFKYQYRILVVSIYYIIPYMLKERSINRQTVTKKHINRQKIGLPSINFGLSTANFYSHKIHPSLDNKNQNSPKKTFQLSGSKWLKRQMRAQSVQNRSKMRESQYSMKMQKSILRFKQKQNLFNRTQKQKKKQTKMYSLQFPQDQQGLSSNNLENKMVKQEIFQEDQLNNQYMIQTLPNICFDSQFSFQREGSCLTLLNNKLYLFGGAIRRKFHYLPEHTQDNNADVLFHSYADDRWNQQPIQNQVRSCSKNLIYHSINCINKKLIVIGGGFVGDTQKTLSKFNNSFIIYNTQNKRMQQIPVNFNIRSHASVSFENYVIYHGGINEELKIKNQIYLIVVNGINSHYSIKSCRFQTNLALAHHQMITTLGEDKNFRGNLRENNGIYLFGGQNQEGVMDNHLKILRISSVSEIEKKGSKFFENIRTFGESPCARKYHSMNLVSSKSLIAIIGGLDVKANPLADVWLMDLIHYKWCRVQTEPNLDMFFGGLYKHSSASSSTSIYVMGGKYLKDIGNSNFWRLDIDHNLNEKKSKGKRLSQVSKISSIWSINPSSHYIKTNDKIVYD